MNISVTTCFYYARLMDMTRMQLDSIGFIPGLDFTSKLLQRNLIKLCYHGNFHQQNTKHDPN